MVVTFVVSGTLNVYSPIEERGIYGRGPLFGFARAVG